MSISSIKFKITVLVGLFAVFMLIVVGTTTYVVSSQSADARIIDIAGRQRMLTQKMFKNALVLVSALMNSSAAEEQSEGLLKTVSLYDRSLKALKDGGMALGTDGKETSLPESTGEAKAQLNKVEGLWNHFRKAMNVITGHSAVTSDEFQNAISDIRNGNVALLDESNKAVVLFKEASEKKTYFLKTVQTAALILTFAVTVISLILTNRMIVRPIEKLSEGAEIFGRGNLDHKVGTDAKDEVGELSRAFDQMIENLKTVTVSRDELNKEITERRKAEVSLRKSESSYRSLFSNMLDGFAYCKIILDESNNPEDFVYLDINNNFEKITGIKKEIVINKKVTEAIPTIKETHPELFDIYGRVAMTGIEEKFDIYFEPLEKWLSISVYSPQEEFFVAVFNDITERKRLEEALLDIEDRERQKIGYDLHDGLGQLLTAIAFRTQTLECALEDKHIPEADDVSLITSLVDQAKDQVSSLAKGVSLVELDREGLMSALEDLASSTESTFNISSNFICNKPVTISSERINRHLYRIAQEAVNNAVKHGKPANITIDLSREDDGIALTVKDDGTGMNGNNNSNGMGLKIMHYRAGRINASLNVHSDIEGGTSVKCILPPENREDKELQEIKNEAQSFSG